MGSKFQVGQCSLAQYAATQAFVRPHGDKLKAELERRREVARIIVDRARTGDRPVNQQQWVAWFREHDDEFRAKMSVAGARRKAANRRLTPAPDIPLLAARLCSGSPQCASAQVGALAASYVWVGPVGSACRPSGAS